MALRAALAYGALVIVATVNREITALLLVVSWLALWPRRWRWGLVFAGLALVTYALVRHAVGDHSNDYTPQHVWWLNTHNPGLLQRALGFNLLLVPLWLAAARQWGRVDSRLKRLTLVVVLVYLPPFVLLAVWQETRLLMPLVILALPIATARQVTT